MRNGAGKTTTVRILSILIPATAGQVRVAGHNVRTGADAVRAVIGVTGQFSAVDNLLTGMDNMLLMADLCHLGRQEGRGQAALLLEEFKLTGAAGKPATTYSGGMRRRLDIAMTLMIRPCILFPDEPRPAAGQPGAAASRDGEAPSDAAAVPLCFRRHLGGRHPRRLHQLPRAGHRGARRKFGVGVHRGRRLMPECHWPGSRKCSAQGSRSFPGHCPERQDAGRPDQPTAGAAAPDRQADRRTLPGKGAYPGHPSPSPQPARG
jgi:hypothetical protein